MSPKEETPKITPEIGTSRAERLAHIFSVIESAPPAASAAEAHALVENAFKSVERRVLMHPDVQSTMSTDAFTDMQTAVLAERMIWYNFYSKHALLIGKNGALEIRGSDKRITGEQEANMAFDQIPVILEKAGADGKKLWE